MDFRKLLMGGGICLIASQVAFAEEAVAEESAQEITIETTQESTRTKDDIDEVYIGESVISASGYEQDIRNAPASISVIDKEDIMSRPLRDLGDAVQDIPGVSVEMQKTGGNSISMRGLGSSYTLILIDGKRQNVTQGFSSNGFGEALNGFMPPPSMIERIEVIRGPASTIYGSDAMGGVINIITKKHSDKTQSGMQIDAKFNENPDVFGNIYGANAFVTTPLIAKMLSLNLRGGYKMGDQNSFLKPAGLVASTSSSVGSNDTSDTQTQPYTNPFATHSATGFVNWNAGFRLNYTPESHNDLYLDMEAFYARVGSLNTSSSSITGIRDFYKVNTVLNHDAKYDWGKINSFLQYSATMWASHQGTQGSGATLTTNGSVITGASKGSRVDWAHKTTNQDLVLQSAYNNNFDLGDYGVIIFNGGIYYLYQHINGGGGNGNYTSSTASGNQVNKTIMDMHQVAIFGEGEYLINEFVSTTLGLRLNYSDRFNAIAIPNPRFYVNVNPTQWMTIKAGVSSGVLVPQLSYLYDGWYFSSGRGGGSVTGVLGDKNLKPETSWNYELSMIFDYKPINVTLTGYYTDFNNKVTTMPYTDNVCTGTSSNGSGSSQCSRVANVDKAFIAGAEVAFKLKPIYYGIGLDMSYAFTHSEITKSSQRNGTTFYADYYKGEALNQVPRHGFVIKPSWTYEGFNVYLRWSGKFQTPTPIPAPNNNTAGNKLVRGAIGKYYKDYQILDLALSYRFLDDKMTATLAVNNLLNTNFWEPILFNNNQNYTNRYQRILPSRNYWLSLRYDF